MDKVVFITGSASGVGLHLTERFLRAGYRVLATDINISSLKQKANEGAWNSEKVWVRKLDITQKAQWKKLWGELMQKWGRVDVICNVAGYLQPGNVHQTPLEQVDRHMDINVKGLIYGSQLAAETMVAQGKGHIINIASLAGIAPIPGIALYSASKFAVRGFSLALAQEMQGRGVSVTVVCPDAIETPMLDLQADYEEAALTFSGGKTLTVNDIGDAIFDKVLPNKVVELMLPSHRGWLAKLSNATPSISTVFAGHLGKVGRAKQALRRKKRQ